MQQNNSSKKKEQVQIDYDLFRDLLMIVCAESNDQKVWDRAAKGLMDKLNKRINRQLYTQFKTAATAEEREQARQKYLDKVGIPERYRYSQEYAEKQRKPT